MNRQGKDRLGQPGADGEVLIAAAAAENRLTMKGQRVVHSGFDATLG
jgi:hypothetical protein